MPDKPNVEAAKVFAELAKHKQDGIWKRRQITWRTNFVLWAALLAIAAVLYREPAALPTVPWGLLISAFVVIFIAHSCHWIGSYVSDEKGMAWMHYYELGAQKNLLNGKPVPDDAPRPLRGQSNRHYLAANPKKLIHGVIAQIAVTAALMAVALAFIRSKAEQAVDHTAPRALSEQDQLSGGNLRIVLEKLPSAAQTSNR